MRKRKTQWSKTATSASSYWAPLRPLVNKKSVKGGYLVAPELVGALTGVLARKKPDPKITRLRARIRSVEYGMEILKAEKKRLAVELRGLIQKKLADEVVGEIAK